MTRSKPTIEDVARRAGVSRSTVSRVMNNQPGASERLRHLVALAATSASVPAVEADSAVVRTPLWNFCIGWGVAASRLCMGRAIAIGEFGLPEVSDGGDFLREDGYAVTRRLLIAHPGIDALFVSCDLMAAGAVQAITATGRTVPGDVSVVGFNDSVAAVCANPPLTTMRMPVEEMAVAATRLLLQGATEPGSRLRLPVELVVRGSTAALSVR